MNIFHFDEDTSVGATRTYIDAWRKLSEYSEVVVVRLAFKKDRVKNYGKHYKEISLKTLSVSRNKWFRISFRALFRENAVSVLNNLDSFFFSVGILTRLHSTLKDCDYIFTYHFWFAFLSVFVPSTRKKVIYHENGGEWVQLTENRAPLLVRLRYGLVGRWVLNRVRVVVHTPTNKLHMRKCGIKSQNISIERPIPIDSSLFYPCRPKFIPPSFVALFVGRITPQKGLHILVEAADIVVNKMGFQNLRFIIVGPVGGFGVERSSPYLESIKKSILDKNLLNNFEFRYFVDAKTLSELYSSSNVFVLPSLQEAYGVAVAEAMMCGTAVITTSTGGAIHNVVEGQTGFLVPPNDPLALAQKISYFVSDNNNSIQMGNKAREVALVKFSMDGYVENLYQIITDKDHLEGD